ncbi:uncharacterized protein LOC119836936 [Zerene cesonia]|uniref:uncharacterized protein LOC119836936 n=1 Tax=Zerene cesonia TaxID=33412 RepID=UPI0018E4FD10|nr:uncharacterized protein LOC119836936 [Zerene cesonia]
MDHPGTSRQGADNIVEDLTNCGTDSLSKEIIKIYKKFIEVIQKSDILTFNILINTLNTVDNKPLIQQLITKSKFDIFSCISKHSQVKMLDYLLEQTELLPYLSPMDKAQRNLTIERTFFNCMCSGNEVLLERFYDYWAGDLHWVYNEASSVNDNENLSNLCILLTNAEEYFKRTTAIKSSHPQTLAEIKCIVIFNEFQIALYEQLSEVKKKIRDWKDISDYNRSILREIDLIKEIINIIFKQVEIYSKRVLSICLDKMKQDDDGISLYWKAQAFYMFKTFFWKMDYNICLLILDNIHLLKKRLIMENNMYQKLESKLYHFIYHFRTKWSFYLSRTSTLESDCISTIENEEVHTYPIPCSVDMGGLIRFLVLYLERDHFIEMLRNFKEELNKPILEKNIRPKNSKFSDEEIQSLTPCPEMRDDYSLKKMLRYLQELPSVSDIKKEKQRAQLLLERILQVVGEFLKSTKESMNLDPTTRALIVAEVPIDVVDSLNNIRDYLSKAKKCKILWRMEIAKHGEDIFEKVLQDLLHLKDAIRKVISINRYFVNRSLIRFGINILSARREAIESKIDLPNYLYSCYSQFLGGCMYHLMERIFLDKFYTETWSKHGLSRSLMIEVGHINHDFNMLDKKNGQEIRRIHMFLSKHFNHYKKVINDLLQKVIYQSDRWNNLKNTLANNMLSDYPNSQDMIHLKQLLKSTNNAETRNTMSNFIDNYTDVEVLWDLIERLFEFLIIKTKSFDATNAELKFSMFTDKYKQLCRNGYKHKDMKVNVESLLKLIEQHCSPKPLSSNISVVHAFDGIKEFNAILNMKQFITEEEIKYISNNIPECRRSDGPMFCKIGNDFCTDMEKNVNTALAIEPFDEQSAKIIRTLHVADRDPELLKCYLERITFLSNIINKQHRDFFVVQYKYNAQFRICLEMILIDLLNISAKCKRIATIQKQNKLLTEINMRNVLAHGNALLEVIGEVLDTNDLPGEIINKSFEFVEDLESVQAIYDLKCGGFCFENIDNDGNIYNTVSITDKEKELFTKFKESKHWQNYLHLIPEYAAHKWSIAKQLKEQEIEAKLKLIEAVKINGDIDNLASILEKVDINHVDDNGNAAIHYAAMNGNLDVIKELTVNMANINIKNEDNKMTALHYAALKGHSEVVNYLVECGADIEKDKQGHTYKDIEELKAEASKKRMEERSEELELDAGDFNIFGMDD